MNGRLLYLQNQTYLDDTFQESKSSLGQYQPWPPQQACLWTAPEGYGDTGLFPRPALNLPAKPCSRLLFNRFWGGPQRQHKYSKTRGLGFPSAYYWGTCSIQLKEYSGFSYGQVQIPARGRGHSFLNC